jgi:virginiamycin B lyase
MTRRPATILRKGQAQQFARTVVAVLGLLVLSLALAARAEAYIYWANDDPSTIGRADLDGTSVDQSFITPATGGVYAGLGDLAVDSAHVYWTGSFAGTIGRADLDGTGVDPSFVTDVYPGGLAVDADHLYWTNPRGDTIGRANRDGSGVDQDFISGTYFASGLGDLATDTSHIYWANYGIGTIGRANLDGTNINQSFIEGYAPGAAPVSLAVDASHIYWANLTTIGRANLGGSGVERFITDPAPFSLLTGLAVDSDHLYWTMGPPYTIGRANLDGTGVDPSFVTGTNYASGIALDSLSDKSPPKTKITKGASKKTEKRKVKFKFKSSEPNSTFECKLDTKKWKACESPKKVKVDEGKHKFKVRAIDVARNVDPSPAKDTFKVVD